MKKLITLFSLLISIVVYSQTLEQRKKITENYDSNRISSFKKDLLINNENLNSKINIFLKNNPDFKKTYTLNSVSYYLIDIDSLGKPIYASTSNYGASRTTRANKLHSGGGLGLNIQGQNMIAGVWEIGSVNTTHNHFQSRVIQKDFSSEPISNHATHVSGTIAQDGNSSLRRGMAFNASVWAHDISNEFTEMLDRASEGLLISNHSYGINFLDSSGNIQSPVDQSGKYIGASRVVDIVHNLSPYYLAVYAAGNERGSQFSINNKNGFDLLSFMGVSKNALTIGAVNQVNPYTGPSSVVMSPFSNWGPTDDGRIKPDLVGKGVNVSSTTGTTTNSFNLSTLSGTSMSSPNVTGTLLLLQQYYNSLYGQFMRAATLKGLALHSADEAGTNDGPDYSFGWGLLNAEAGANTITGKGLKSEILELTLNPGETKSFTYTAEGGSIPLMASISWNDLAGEVNVLGNDDPTPALVNDLDIRVTNSTTTYFPWKLNPANYTGAATQGDNIVDPFEKVHINNPNGSYTINITHKGTLLEPQNFTFIATGINSSFTIRSLVPSKEVCDGNTVDFSIQYLSNINFTGTTIFTTTGLPNGIVSSFTSTSLNTNGNTTLNLSNFNSIAPGTYNFEVVATSGSISKNLTFILKISSSNFSPLINLLPLDNSINIPHYTNLTWDNDVNAQSYIIEIATDINFNNIFQNETINNNIFLTNELNNFTEYFWRVKSTNQCGSSNFSNPLKFRTINLNCTHVSNTNVISIANTANTSISSIINFSDINFNSIYDIDVDLNISHTYVEDMTIKLLSPNGTELILQKNACGSQDDIIATYDDNGKNIVCSSTAPGINGRIKSFENLSLFNGKNPNGDWTLVVDDPYSGDGGSLNSWGIKICQQNNLSSNDFDISNISLYPNPASNQLYLQSNEAISNAKVKIIDIAGKVVYNNINYNIEQPINIENLSQGFYIFQITNNDKSYTKKFIKK